MKAWVVVGNGAPSATTLQLKTDWPTPPPPPTGANIMVRISHAALNPVDLHLINVLPTWLPFRRHATPAFDFCGEVVAAGSAVPAASGVKVGAQVCGAMGVAQVTFGTGALAEYVVVPAELVAVKPEGVTPAQAAGVAGIAGQTAVLMERTAGLASGQRVLVNGASGGVGSILVHLAKARGAMVYGVCSAANAAMVTRLGADEAIDYRTHDPVENFIAERFRDEPLDFIFDCAGSQALYSHSPRYLKPGGAFINIVGGRTQGIVPFVRNKLWPVLLGGTPRTYHLLGLAPSGNFARDAAKLVADGLIKEVPIDSEYAMEDVILVSTL